MTGPVSRCDQVRVRVGKERVAGHRWCVALWPFIDVYSTSGSSYLGIMIHSTSDGG